MNAAGSNDRHKLMSYWGYRFETICNISKPVSELRRISTKTKKRGASLSALTDSVPQSKLARFDQQQEGRQPEGDVVGSSSDTQGNVENQTRDSDDKDGVEEKKEVEEEKAEEVDESTAGATDQIDLEDPELTGRLDGIVDTNLQYCTVVRTKIGKNSIIMGAEVDCTSGEI